MIEQAIILAAGEGRRLYPYTKDLPKCLLQVSGKSILEHQVDTLFSEGIERITVVTGYLEEKVRAVLGDRVHYIENREYGDTSSMYSLWMARSVAADGFLVLNSDVLFHAGILRTLLESPHPDALAIDLEARLEEEEMKVILDGEKVVGLSKEFPQANGENVGMIKFGPDGSRVLFAAIEDLLRRDYRRVMVPFAVNTIVGHYRVMAVPVAGRPWIEIDFPEDYRRACEVIYPAIVETSPSQG